METSSCPVHWRIYAALVGVGGVNTLSAWRSVRLSACLSAYTHTHTHIDEFLFQRYRILILALIVGLIVAGLSYQFEMLESVSAKHGALVKPIYSMTDPIHFADQSWVHKIDIEKTDPEVRHTSTVVDNSLCKFHRSIFYLKIYKTGSSTMSTILGRMVLKYSLKQVPVQRNMFPSRDPLSLVMRPPGNATSLGPYEVFNDHTLYTKDIDTIMATNTTFIASIRFPLTQLRALFEEFRIAEQLKITSPNPVLNFLENIDQYGSQLILTRNIHALYFGLQSS